ncbi:O-acyltransferase like protein-like [Epargyreus clarus]|uniref:O-acyltransferase like protein-like n=1 Tax=Epargyreus clarus TaxID=520877 RepID=UPI003C2ACCD7
MGALWIWLAVVAMGDAALLSDEEYYQMPKLFQLDDYDECLARPGGAFCVGSFELAGRTNTHLMHLITQYTDNRYHFNRSRIHRGLCVTTTCAHIDHALLPRRFEACVDNITRSHGLEAHLYHLDYCETAQSPPRMPIDEVDLGFLGLVMVILAANVIGTVYDLLRNPDNKPNRLLMPWSLRVNWNRLTASYEDGDPRLNHLNPVHGMKCMTLIFVMLAHSVIVYHMAYIYNPQFLEIASQNPMSTILHNGSVIVQTFITLSSFLLAYNLLLHLENKQGSALKLFPKVVFQRIARITPVHMFVVGVAATWWRFASSGPLWSMVEGESARCRAKWWAQALYIHNFVKADDKCLLQTWFLAVDMQLYIAVALLTLSLARRRALAERALAALLLLSVAANFLVAYMWNLKPILYVTYPELMRHQYTGEPSFNWLYTAPWGSLPASLLGLYAAFVYYRLQKDGVKLDEKLWYRLTYRLAIVGIPTWIMAGYVIQRATSRPAVALYAALDRPVFALIIVICMIGFFYRIDAPIWRLLTWRGWQVLSRMSLSILMVHWGFNLTQMAIKTTLSRASIYEIGGHWFTTIFMTYLTSLPLHLLVELPLQRFLQALFTR